MEFKGCSQESAEVYVLDYKVHDEDLEAGYPLSGQRGAFICSLLGSMSLLDKTRMASWQGQGADAVKEDIIACQPKVIVGLGSELMGLFVDTSRRITDMSGEVTEVDINGQRFKYLVLMSPSYVLNRIEDQDLALRFSQDLFKAFQIVIGEFKDILKEKEVLSAHSFEEFKEIYESRFLNDNRIAYDIETNARPIYTVGGEIIGFSIANKHSGVYVSMRSLDFNMPDEEVDLIWEYLINNVFEIKEKLIIHNTMYERPYTLYCKGYEIPYDKADDTLVMARLLRGAKEGAGLKFQAQKNLHYPDWETDLSRYISGFRDAVNRIGLGPKKFTETLWVEMRDNDISIYDLEMTDSYQNLSDEDKEEISATIHKLKSPLYDLYTDPEIHEIGYLLTEKIIKTVNQGGILDSTIPYNYIPDRVLSKYGAVDSLATYDLCDFFEEMMDNESTDLVDLHLGYRNWLESMYVAYIMERNGMCWNEELVHKDEMFLTAQATNCLKSMLTSPLFVHRINEVCEWKYKPIILSDYMPNLAASQGYSVEYSHDTGKYIVKYQGKRVAKGRISEIEILPAFQSEYYEIVHSMYTEEINKATHYEQLKDFYNPSSSTQSDIPRQILMTEDLQMGGRINALHTLAVSPEFEPLIDKIPIIDQKFLKIASILHEADDLKKQYGKEWAQKRKEFYSGFCALYEGSRHMVSTPEIKAILEDKCPVVIESFDDAGIIDIYNAYVVTGIDQDDRSTWTPVFEWMINFRLYKKSQKLISSYINGTVGRQTVVVVDKEALTSGSHCMERKRGFFDENCRCDDNEAHLVASKWSPNTAETGRWRSAFHTIPWGSQVKKYYTSRFKGGTICCPDYSQMEVRTLAAVSHDENMLNLFKEGKDFHTETAKKVWQKEEVTTAERRFSKTATFSLLYGAMETSFANNYCNGDMAMAEKIYGGFYRAYPSVQTWIKERHEEVKRDHRVSLDLSGRFIPITPEGDGVGAINAMCRKSQNYPIQGSSADLVTGVVYDLQKFLEDNGMKSMLFMSVHDSIEFDIYPYEMLKFVEKMKFILNDSPMKRMGLPSKADVAMGKSLGHEIELKKIDCSEDYTEAILVLEGFKDEIEETVETWKEAYEIVDVLEEEWEENYVSMGDLFILRKAFTPTLGTMRYTGKAKIHIKYYKDGGFKDEDLQSLLAPQSN